MDADQIIREIERLVQRDYGNWYVGITADPEQRKADHGNPATWRAWDAESEGEARAVERYFLARGMDGGVGGGADPTYVYVYQLGAISLEELLG